MPTAGTRPGRLDRAVPPDRKRTVIAERFRPTDRLALITWASCWASVMFFVAVAPRALPTLYDGRPYLERWTQWDAARFVNLATYGYDGVPGQPFDPGWPAFFPGYPLALRVVGGAVGDYRLAGLLISLVAGAIAMVALARLADVSGPAGAGRRTVFALLAGPAAVFMFAGYSESLFLACALPAWLLARSGRWPAAMVLAAAASTVRITGLFLAIALIVLFVLARRTGEPDRPPWRAAGWLIVPFLPLAAYSAYQWRRTGDWLAWQHAQAAGWGRELVWPWQAFDTTWGAAFDIDNEFTLAFRIELVAALVGVGLTIYLLIERQWPEFVFVGLQVAALITSSFYLSIGRATLLWWPLWIALGTLGARRPGAYIALLAFSIPFAVLQLLTFTAGAWAG